MRHVLFLWQLESSLGVCPTLRAAVMVEAKVVPCVEGHGALAVCTHYLHTFSFL